ncbi:MAG: branched-chain amino acid ABC transporter permease [Burkholderiales bacterium]|nr:branched-chain amino acid ABC transporter permease [Anaerolineae bacterium]
MNAVSLGAIYALFALGYALVFSVLGVLNLAHSAIFMSGAFFGLLLLQAGLPLMLAFPLAMIASGILGVVLERVAFYPLRRRNAPRISQLISSIGAAILIVNIVQLIFNNLYNSTEQYFPRDLIPTEPIQFAGVAIQPIRLLILVVALALMVLLQLLVTRTRTGLAMRAVAFDQRVASLLGINTGQIFLLTFFLAGALGGAGGLLYGLAFTRVTPFMGQEIALVGLTAIVLGGLGNVQGAVIGGFIVAALQTFSTAVVSSSYRDAIVFILFFLVLLFRPQGLLGQARQDKV